MKDATTGSMLDGALADGASESLGIVRKLSRSKATFGDAGSVYVID